MKSDLQRFAVSHGCQRNPEHCGCMGDYLAHENAIGNLCSAKPSLTLIGRVALNKQNIESYAQFDRREYAAHSYGTLRYSSVDGEDDIQCAENELLESVSTGHKPRSACITVTVARLSQIPAAL